MDSLDRFSIATLAKLDSTQLKRSLVETVRAEGGVVHRNGQAYVSFSCNDYLNLTHHPSVKQAAMTAIEMYGVGSGASRLVTGNHPLFNTLESRLAALKGTGAACVFGSGYLANAGIIPSLVGRDDLLIVDELAHSCLWAGARLSRAKVWTFRHNDVAHAASLLSEKRSSCRYAMLVTETVFSMDGDCAPLSALATLAAQHDAWLMTDDAHGLGVLNINGRHSREHLQMGTLSKTLGSYGGYLCASKPVVDLIKTRARTLIYSTGLPPASVAAAVAALEILIAQPELTKRPLQKAQRFTRAAGLSLAQSAVVPIVLGDPATTLMAQSLLEEEGFLAVAIRPPTVAEGTARLRLAFSAAHADDVVDRLAAVVRARILPLRKCA